MPNYPKKIGENPYNPIDPCAQAPPVKSRQYNGGPQIGELMMVVPGQAGGNAVGDVYSGKLQFPATFLFMAACGQQGTAGDPGVLPSTPFDIMVHFRPLGLKYNSGQPLNVFFNTPMPWINFGGKIVGRWMSFKNPFQEFWVDSGGAVAATNITWIYSNDIEYIANFANQT